MDWYFMEGERRVGPVTEQHLRDSLERGGLPHDTLVWNEQLEDWTPASQVLDLTPVEADAWYYRSNTGAPVGPVSSQEVARHVLSGELGPDDLVCHVGDTVWEPISSDRELLDAIAALRHERHEHPGAHAHAPQRPAANAAAPVAPASPAEAHADAPATGAAPARSQPHSTGHVPFEGAATGAAEWYQRALGGEKGPFTLAQLQVRVKQGALSREDLVRGPHHDDWTRAADVPELAPAFSGKK